MKRGIAIVTLAISIPVLIGIGLYHAMPKPIPGYREGESGIMELCRNDISLCKPLARSTNAVPHKTPIAKPAPHKRATDHHKASPRRNTDMHNKIDQ